MNLRRSLLIISIILVAFVIGIVAPAAQVGALPGGVGFQRGYFTDASTPGSGFGAVISACNGTSVADSSMTNKATFIAKILTYYNGCGSSPYNRTRNSVGGRFIIQSMRGTRSPTVGAAEIADWQNRINNPAISISWVVNASFSVNSGYTGSMGIGVNDDAFYNAGGNHDALVFRDSGNNIVYMLKSNCANPVGTLSVPPPPPPPVNWAITPTITVSPASVSPGATITWTHKITNSGSTTDSAVSYDYKNSSGFPNNSTGGSGTLPSGSTDGAFRTFTSTFTPGFSDIGKTFCRVTEAQPRAKGNNGLIASGAACATVTAPPNVCRPILISTPNATTYPAVSHTAPNGTVYSAAAKTVPYTVSTSVQSWGPYTTAQRIDATLNHTTGDVYTVTFRETSNHVTGYTDNYVAVYNYVPAYNYITVGSPPNTRRVRVAPYQTRVAPFTRYTNTTTNYGGPATWTSSFGPCYDYMLTTGLNNFASKLEPDSVISINPTVNSASWTQSNYRIFWNAYGTHSKSKPSKWQITKMVIAPNAALPAAIGTSNSALAPCSYYDPTNITTCSAQATSASTVFNANGVPSPSTNVSFSIPDSPAGTKLCFAFSLYPTQSDPANTTSSWGAGDLWSHAAFNPVSNCVIIVKKPKSQIWGSDLWAAASITSSTSVKNIGGDHTFGSWVEYGIFSPATILGTASGSAFAGTTGLAGNNPVCNYTMLTFTNAGTSICSNGTIKGNYTNAHNLPDIASSFVGGASIANGSSVNPNTLIAGSGTYIGNVTGAGNITLLPGTISPGKSIIIKASGTVTITGNITYNASNNGAKYTNGYQLPQLIIIADKIIINDVVTNVDAWLVANGANGIIETCNTGSLTYALSGANRLTINKCNQLLRVNGPVMAKQLWLRRTAGSGVGAASNDPAEVFNLRADTFLWAAAHADTSSHAQTVDITELPARF